VEDDDDDYRMEDLMNFSGRYGRGKINMNDNDSDSDEDRNEYQNDEIMTHDDIGGVYLNDLEREGEDYD
jgi:hypothetical protein